jgi:hypothetical protein
LPGHIFLRLCNRLLWNLVMMFYSRLHPVQCYFHLFSRLKKCYIYLVDEHHASTGMLLHQVEALNRHLTTQPSTGRNVCLGMVLQGRQSATGQQWQWTDCWKMQCTN